jgi:2-polyprenyl-3-methyl-5-hydroxy-6-metoxy-1,4-benzoquinol methylase
MKATSVNAWDEHAEAYERFVTDREGQDLSHEPILIRFWELLGDLHDRKVLDACCGTGFLSRILAARGAHVTGIDISPRLIQKARQHRGGSTVRTAEASPEPVPGREMGLSGGAEQVTYLVRDLSQPLPELESTFDAIASYLALNDVPDHRGFATTLASLAKPGTPIVLAMNNPYSFVLRGTGHITDYFENGARGTYGGLSSLGVSAQYYHRTLEEYLDAFFAVGLRLTKLADVASSSLPGHLPHDVRFPRFTILAFEKPLP